MKGSTKPGQLHPRLTDDFEHRADRRFPIGCRAIGQGLEHDHRPRRAVRTAVPVTPLATYVKGPTMMVDSIFNSNRGEDW